MQRNDTFQPRLVVTTVELEEAWSPRDEWGASGPLLIEDEGWIIIRHGGGYALERVGDNGNSYVAFSDLQTADDICALGDEAEKFVDEVEKAIAEDENCLNANP